jgi:hypothetical protein
MIETFEIDRWDTPPWAAAFGIKANFTITNPAMSKKTQRGLRREKVEQKEDQKPEACPLRHIEDF